MRIKVPGKAEEEVIYVPGGILEVQPDHVTVLADTASVRADLDEAKVLEAKQALAEEALRARARSTRKSRAVEAELAVLNEQLKAIAKLRPGRR